MCPWHQNLSAVQHWGNDSPVAYLGTGTVYPPEELRAPSRSIDMVSTPRQALQLFHSLFAKSCSSLLSLFFLAEGIGQLGLHLSHLRLRCLHRHKARFELRTPLREVAIEAGDLIIQRGISLGKRLELRT